MPAKSATKPAFSCSECGWTTSKWVGRCGECQAWGTVDEAARSTAVRTPAAAVSTKAVPISEVGIESAVAQSSGVAELDRVLGGGVVPGAVMLLAGEPGVGKSTLLLEVAAAWAKSGRRTLYVSGEESAAQVRLRAERTGAVHPELFLAAETDLGSVLTHISSVEPSLLIVDSVQTLSSSVVDGAPGGVTQVREVAAAIIAQSKTSAISTLLVGHVTKDGSVAGPRTLEHLVDVVLQFEGDRTSRLRLLRAIKNRFGPVDEIGCFDLVDHGIVEVPDPTGLFTSRHEQPVPGTCVTVTIEGRRPLLAEVQALTVGATTPSPRRTSSGLDSARVAMILAVLAKHAGLNIGTTDVYTASVGGARLTEPAVDVAAALAVMSAYSNKPLPSGLVAFGEVGLAGEVRSVSNVAARIREAARIGFTHAIVPAGALTENRQQPPPNIRVITVSTVGDAISAAKRLAVSVANNS